MPMVKVRLHDRTIRQVRLSGLLDTLSAAKDLYVETIRTVVRLPMSPSAGMIYAKRDLAIAGQVSLLLLHPR